jgi:hypothetical protein
MATPNQKFKLPEIQSKTVADTTKKIYKAHLNRLAKINIDTPELILANQHTIVKLITDTIPGDEVEDKQKKRIWMSAILYAIADKPEVDKKVLKTYFPETFNYPEPGTKITLQNGQEIVWKSREEYFKDKK